MPRLEVQYWAPDTCGCRFYVDCRGGGFAHISQAAVQALQDARIAAGDPTASKAALLPVVLCPAHAAQGDTAGLLTAILEESQRKNYFADEARKVLATIQDSDVNWSYTVGRVLQVSFRMALSTTQKNNIQNLCNTRFGAGKVQVV